MKQCCYGTVGSIIERILKGETKNPKEAMVILRNLVHVFDHDALIVDRSYLEDHPAPEIQENLKMLDKIKAALERPELTVIKGEK